MSDATADDRPEADVPPGGVGPDPSAAEAVADAPGEASDESVPASVEELIAALEATTAERDEYLDVARRTQAEFENHRKRVAKQHGDEVLRAVAALVEELLPVLDACDGAIAHGSTDVEPVFAALLQSLEKQGLERIDPLGDAFDPSLHEAVMHEPATDDDDGTVVSDVMRPGYGWKGHVIRPAMVKVRG